MRRQSSKKLYYVTLIFNNNLTRTAKVKATSREVAEERALKRNPNAIGVKRDG